MKTVEVRIVQFAYDRRRQGVTVADTATAHDLTFAEARSMVQDLERQGLLASTAGTNGRRYSATKAQLQSARKKLEAMISR